MNIDIFIPTSCIKTGKGKKLLCNIFWEDAPSMVDVFLRFGGIYCLIFRDCYLLDIC
jgi:hypothetical protein